MIVAKFGGSSVRDASSMLNCVEVVEGTPNCGVVIISATYNTTNDLERLFDLIHGGLEIEGKSLWREILQRHLNIAEELNLDLSKDISERFDELHEEVLKLFHVSHLGPKERDQLLSVGERLSSWLFYKALLKRFENRREIQFLYAPEVLKTNSNFGLASPNFEIIQQRIQGSMNFLEDGGLLVTQGFIGSDEFGDITTLGREGSDYTATLMGGALSAKEVHIWTDVAGIYNADPNVVPDAQRIETLSFDEASLMAKAGAKVLFPKTLEPIRGKGTVVKVGMTKDPSAGYTLIREGSSSHIPLLGITVKERSNGIILTIIGEGVFELDVEVSEIDRGENFRSFFLSSTDTSETVNLWYKKYFNS